MILIAVTIKEEAQPGSTYFDKFYFWNKISAITKNIPRRKQELPDKA